MNSFAAVMIGVVALCDATPSCQPADEVECEPQRGYYYLGYRPDDASPIALRMTANRTSVEAGLYEPEPKCSITPDESYEVVACPGTQATSTAEHVPGCGDTFCIRVLSYPPTLWFELGIHESGCALYDGVSMEELKQRP